MFKKIVHYRKASTIPPVEGGFHIVLPIDHPGCTNEGVPAVTSKVIRVFSGGFETENSVYIEDRGYDQV